jgi:hypothetical protein
MHSAPSTSLLPSPRLLAIFNSHQYMSRARTLAPAPAGPFPSSVVVAFPPGSLLGFCGITHEFPLSPCWFPGTPAIMHQVQSPYDASATSARHPLRLPSAFAFLLRRLSPPSCHSQRPENLSPKDSLLCLPTLASPHCQAPTSPSTCPQSRRRCVRPILMTHPLSRPCLGMSPKLPTFPPWPHLIVSIAIDGFESPVSASEIIFRRLPRPSCCRWALVLLLPLTHHLNS